MYILFFLMWIIFNGRITTEIVIFGIVISAAVYWFICKFMDYSFKKDLKFMKKLIYIVQYLYYLVKEIVVANFVTMKLVLSSHYAVEPVLIEFETSLNTNTAKFLLANSITLTPGTITVSVEGNKFTVHCLDKTLAEGIDDSVFVKLLSKMEK